MPQRQSPISCAWRRISSSSPRFFVTKCDTEESMSSSATISYILCPLMSAPDRDILYPSGGNQNGAKTVLDDFCSGRDLHRAGLYHYHWSSSPECQSAEHEEWRVAVLHGRPEGDALFAFRPDQRVQFQRTGSRLAVQNRQPRYSARIQTGGYVSHGEKHPLCNGRNAPRRSCSQGRHRRTPVDAFRV